MKRLQRATLALFKGDAQQRAHRKLNSQNRFARRYGLRWLKLSVNLLLASVAITTTYQFVLYLEEKGALSRPQSLDRLVRD